jgi:hypothetical protein
MQDDLRLSLMQMKAELLERVQQALCAWSPEVSACASIVATRFRTVVFARCHSHFGARRASKRANASRAPRTRRLGSVPVRVLRRLDTPAST